MASSIHKQVGDLGGLTIMFYHILLHDPLVAVVYNHDLPKSIDRTVKHVDGAIAHLFVKPSWYGPEVLSDLTATVTQHAATNPNIHITIMAATSEEDVLFRSRGIDSIWCNQNAFLDGRIYKPDLKAEKLYDAIYIARLVPFKRHNLAAKVPRLAVVSNLFDVKDDYVSTCLNGYSDLQFINYEAEEGVKVMPPEKLGELLTHARCGLALSAKEGAMFAAAEYLLTGLPVVTTPSMGGRDVFFHPDYVEVVEETPEAVRDGVARLIARNLDPQMIRERTFELFMAHRFRLIMRLSGLAQRDLFTQAGENLWLPQFINKLETWVD